jgi:hypothetical protein
MSNENDMTLRDDDFIVATYLFPAKINMAVRGQGSGGNGDYDLIFDSYYFDLHFAWQLQFLNFN